MSQADAGTLGSECHIYGDELKKKSSIFLYSRTSILLNQTAGLQTTCHVILVYEIKNKNCYLHFWLLVIEK